jgi:hypothetical protein
MLLETGSSAGIPTDWSVLTAEKEWLTVENALGQVHDQTGTLHFFRKNGLGFPVTLAVFARGDWRRVEPTE